MTSGDFDLNRLHLSAFLQGLDGLARDASIEPVLKPISQGIEARVKELQQIHVRRGEARNLLKQIISDHRKLINDWRLLFDDVSVIGIETTWGWAKAHAWPFLMLCLGSLLAAMFVAGGHAGASTIWIVGSVLIVLGAAIAIAFWSRLHCQYAVAKAFRDSLATLKMREGELVNRFRTVEDSMAIGQDGNDSNLEELRKQLRLLTVALESGYSEGLALKSAR